MPTMRCTLLLGVALAFGAAQAASSDRWVQVKEGAWQIDSATLSAVRASFATQVLALAKQSGKHLLPLRSYWLQTQGQLDGGVRVVLVNALCDVPSGADLRADLVTVDDGGNCYFTVKYDPSTHRFFELIVNGVA